MPHLLDGTNLDATKFKSLEHARDHYLNLTKGWKPHYPKPVVKIHNGIRVVRDDLIVGTKARGGDLLLAKIPEQTIVYTQARVGLAGVSLLDCAKYYHKQIVLFMAASHKISYDQACCIERGAIPIFRRCAAMNNLAVWGQQYAQQHGAAFAPLGLKHELCTAGIIYAAVQIPEPEVVFTVIATGVLSRALQIAWPNAKFFGIAVGRSLKAGEAGRAKIITDPLKFLQKEKAVNLPPFPAVQSYDAKAWKYVTKYQTKNPHQDILFWNVGATPHLNDPSVIERTNSWREWPNKGKHK